MNSALVHYITTPPHMHLLATDGLMMPRLWSTNVVLSNVMQCALAHLLTKVSLATNTRSPLYLPLAARTHVTCTSMGLNVQQIHEPIPMKAVFHKIVTDTRSSKVYTFRVVSTTAIAQFCAAKPPRTIGSYKVSRQCRECFAI